MYPELFRIGGFTVHAYGVLLALAFLLALVLSARLAARDGLPRERIYDLGLWLLVAAIVGSKLLMLVAEPEYRENPLRLLSLDFLRSGGVFYGGLLASVAVAVLLVRRFRLPWWRTADAFAPAIALGQSIGRQGCFAAGCCWGKPTTLPWGVRFSERGHEVTGVPTNVPLHPTQLYESAAALSIFLLLLWLHRRKRFDGQVVLAYGALYAGARFAIEFFRDDPRGDVFGLTSLTGLSTSQLISLLVGAASLCALALRWRRAGGSTSRAEGDAAVSGTAASA
jgi:phosphatidylglycerol:prolipoprotein diacylglycerol transferase